MAEKFLDDSERLYGEPHPTRHCVRSSRRIVVKVQSFIPSTVPHFPPMSAARLLAAFHMTTDPTAIPLSCYNCLLSLQLGSTVHTSAGFTKLTSCVAWHRWAQQW